MASLAASITSGTPWPDGAPCDPGSVLIFSAEEEVAETIRPKIDAAGGDPRRVHIIDGVLEQLAATPDADKTRWFSLARDTAALEATIRKHGARVVFFDVLASYMGGTDTHRDSDTRSILGPLAKVAADTGTAIIALRHLTKAVGVKAIKAGGGSIAFSGQARAVYTAVKPHPDEPKHLLACAKLNVARRPKTWSYTLDSHPFTDADGRPGEVARVAWGEQVDIDADDALASSEASPDARDARDEARDFLRHALINGPRKTAEVEAEAIAEGISTRTLKRARKDLGVTSGRDGFQGGFVLTLPNLGPMRSNTLVGPDRDQEHPRTATIPRIHAGSLNLGQTGPSPMRANGVAHIGDGHLRLVVEEAFQHEPEDRPDTFTDE